MARAPWADPGVYVVAQQWVNSCLRGDGSLFTPDQPIWTEQHAVALEARVTPDPPIKGKFEHAYAEPQHDLAYKPEKPPSDMIRRELAWVAASSWGADQAIERVPHHRSRNRHRRPHPNCRLHRQPRNA